MITENAVSPMCRNVAKNPAHAALFQSPFPTEDILVLKKYDIIISPKKYPNITNVTTAQSAIIET